MPHYHIAMAHAKDFDETERRAAEGLGPRYAVPPMVRRLGATLHQADRDAAAPSLGERLRARLVGTPKSWSLARTLAARLGSDDVVYCLDAEIGLPLAGALRRTTRRPKQAVFLHNLDRPRGRLAAKLVRAA